MLLREMPNINKVKYQEIFNLQENILLHQKNNLIETIEKNELLSYDLQLLQNELKETKFMQYILYTIILSIFIISILVYAYINLKKKFNSTDFRKQDLEFKLKEVEFKLSNNVREAQELIYTKDEIDVEDLKIQNNNLINLIKNLRK
jgi:hypothetical protein